MTGEQESEIRARARIEIICRGGPMCPPEKEQENK